APDSWSPSPEAASPPAFEILRCAQNDNRPYAVGIWFVRGRDELERIGLLAAALQPKSSLWVAWPRKAGGHVSDMTEQAIRDAALPLGLVDVKVAALDNDWSGLKLVWRVSKRKEL